MSIKMIKYGTKLTGPATCPCCKGVNTMTHPEPYGYTCNTCGAIWADYPNADPSVCPECGKSVDRGCSDCKMTYGRRGWRQLGVYDG